MLRPLGRAPSYSGKCIARAVELYSKGVKPGYVRWDELQSTLEKEFAQEFQIKGQDKPSPETVMGWVRKYPDAPERLRGLRVQQTDPSWEVCGTQTKLSCYQPQPAVPITCVSITNTYIMTCLNHLIAIMAMMIMVRLAWSLSQD